MDVDLPIASTWEETCHAQAKVNKEKKVVK
jgi:hypothetical protein